MKARLASLSAALAVCFAGVGPAAAQISNAFPIATNLAFKDLGDGIAFDGSNYLVGLVSATTNVSLQLVSSNGTLLGAQINASGSSNAEAMAGPVFLGTNYLVIWSDAPIVSNVNMFGQLISRAGAKVGPVFNMLQSAGTHGAQVAKALGSDGTNFLAVWEDASTEFYYGQLLKATGSLSGSEFLISGQSLNGGSAAVAFGKTNYLVIWESDNGVSGHAEVYGEIVSVNGTAGEPFQISQTAYADEKVVDAIATAFDRTNFLAVWMWNPGPQTSGTLTNWQIYGRLISPTGAFPGNELVLTSNRNQQLPSLAFDGSNYLLTYGYDSNTTNSDINMFNQFLDRSGSPVGPIFSPFAAIGTEVPFFAVNGTLFDGNRFVIAGTLGSMSATNYEVLGTFLPSSVAQPTLAALHPVVANHLPMVLTGTPGINYAIQVSANLSSAGWTALVTNSPTNGTFTFTDTATPGPGRFYRAVKQ